MFSGATIRSMQEAAAVKAARERRVPFVVWPGDDLSAFPFPSIGDYVPIGWRQLTSAETGLDSAYLPGVTNREYVNVLVDSSGFGGEDEPALTPSGLRTLIERLNVWADEKKATVGWAITEIGQFQVVVAAFIKS